MAYWVEFLFSSLDKQMKKISQYVMNSEKNIYCKGSFHSNYEITQVINF